jgi:GNAT superfamily N-acetyltransferase
VNPDVELSIRQFTGAWRHMASRSPAPRIESRDGLDLVFCGLPVPFFNIGFITAERVSGDALRALGRDAASWAGAQGLPWLLVTTNEAIEAGVDADAILAECGMAPAMRLTGMHADRVTPGAGVPDGLALTTPEDDAACGALLDVNSAAYGMDLGAGREAFGRTAFWQGQFPILGTAEGQPACCAAVMMVEGCRYVALVATNPSQQRRGYAAAAMRRALELASSVHGERPTVLHATDAGLPVYQRMGYSRISTHGVYMEQRLLEGH